MKDSHPEIAIRYADRWRLATPCRVFGSVQPRTRFAVIDRRPVHNDTTVPVPTRKNESLTTGPVETRLGRRSAKPCICIPAIRRKTIAKHTKKRGVRPTGRTPHCILSAVSAPNLPSSSLSGDVSGNTTGVYRRSVEADRLTPAFRSLRGGTLETESGLFARQMSLRTAELLEIERDTVVLHLPFE